MQDWTLIIVGHQIFIRNPNVITAVVAMAFMALGQRGLACVGHDSIHGNLVRKRVSYFPQSLQPWEIVQLTWFSP